MQNRKESLADHYITQNGKKLHYGYTTGSCAAAAAKAAAIMLLSGKQVVSVQLMTPMGIRLYLSVEEICIGQEQARCGIKKYAGDDPDVTDGIIIYATVSRVLNKINNGAGAGSNKVSIEGGTGIGRVRRGGLDQPVGCAAINRVPREMIEKEVQEVCLTYGCKDEIEVFIEAPKGIELAEKTFNPRLGIEGGISILGTSGIVVPMSEEALLKTIQMEIQMHLAEGEEEILVTPGNYGENFIREQMGESAEKNIHCSNYVGKTIDMAANLGIKKIRFVAHIGKFIKVAGGIMDTHSKNADCRAELMAACAIRAGADIEVAEKILDTVNTEEGVSILKKAGILEKTMGIMMERIGYYLKKRAGEKMEIHAVVYSCAEGKLGEV